MIHAAELVDHRRAVAEVARALQQKKVDRLIGIGTTIGAHAAVIGEWFGGETAYYPIVATFREDLHRLHFHDETVLLKGARIFEFEEIDKWLTEQIHQTVMEVDLNAMAANLRAYRQLLQPATKVMAMVKAFAYGSGSFEIASLLQFHGVDYLGVAYADEGVALRKAGIRVPIMVMNTENAAFDCRPARINTPRRFLWRRRLEAGSLVAASPSCSRPARARACARRGRKSCTWWQDSRCSRTFSTPSKRRAPRPPPW